ncbi:MAG: hypothetical protein ABJG86_11215 [Nitratireductor sp.]
MPPLTWTEVAERCDRIGLSRAEMARRAGISESTVVKGLARRSKPRGTTRRIVEMVLEAAEITGETQDKGALAAPGPRGERP